MENDSSSRTPNVTFPRMSCSHSSLLRQTFNTFVWRESYMRTVTHTCTPVWNTKPFKDMTNVGWISKESIPTSKIQEIGMLAKRTSKKTEISSRRILTSMTLGQNYWTKSKNLTRRRIGSNGVVKTKSHFHLPIGFGIEPRIINRLYLNPIIQETCVPLFKNSDSILIFIPLWLSKENQAVERQLGQKSICPNLVFSFRI